ncbi:tRNA dihydrouridine synthase DusB [Candidatus Omnitrophota bacterium]
MTVSPIDKMIAEKVVMAPMAGVADMPFRLMARKFGCGFAFTEMIDVNGIFYKSRNTFHLMERHPGDHPLGVQLVGQDEERIVHAARLCEEQGFEMLDINAGCPARKVVKCGKGAALLREPDKLARIIRRLKKELTIPITVKIRSGWNSTNLTYMEIAKAVASEGASAICVHSRTRDQFYKGKADHNVVREIKETLDIPVFASGNILEPEDVSKVMEMTGCDAVFVARGALGRPWIFKEIKSVFGGEKDFNSPSFEELKSIIMEHFKLSCNFFSAKRAFARMYKHLCWYLKRFKDLDPVMREYRKVKDMESFREFMDRLQLDNGKYLVLERIRHKV